MEFSPFNPVVKRCLQGMNLEEKGKPEEAAKLFLQAWNEATNDFEKYLAAYYVSRHQKTEPEKLKWLETALTYALKINDDAVKSALPALYSHIAKCYEESGDTENSKKYAGLAMMFKHKPSAKGPFYHGTKADLKVGGLLTPGFNSNYRTELKMNHIYFTALISGAGLAAELAKGDREPRVYVVEPTGRFENDPNVTDKKFPGNPTRSYRSQDALKIIDEITDWRRLPPEELQNWQKRLADAEGAIIN